MSNGCGKSIDGWHRCGSLEMGSEIVPLCEKCKEPVANKEKLTQGEWSFHRDGTIRNNDCNEIIAICSTTAPLYRGKELANANLMATAPEMYRELERDLNDQLKAQKAIEGKLVDEWLNNGIKRKQNILAKARGEHEKT